MWKRIGILARSTDRLFRKNYHKIGYEEKGHFSADICPT
jgi:hypothetical protein